MAEVTLRAYSRDIDELIERERLEEAIAHCRHLLQTYPKHLETYRLLGKAYLEAKRYGDAADIFQRVLSAVPDDFVSHIGMAIVREDEGNLDAAIWHMERAFETNPSNPAIQQEMKRLIGRRDGLEPHKVRLTRGALARMYAHGELYPQAIAELRSALQEDRERPDLQVLLAEMYWRTDQRTEATSVANQVLEKLPYCLEANRILAANLQAKDRIEEAAHYHRRLANLDPYAAFVESAMADPAAIEDSAVSIERFDWQPGEPLPDSGPSQPGWAATLGMEIRQSRERGEEPERELPQTGPLPSWLEPGEPPPFAGSSYDDHAEGLSQAEFEDDSDSTEPDWLAEGTAVGEDEPEADESASEEDFMRELSEAGDMPEQTAESELAEHEAEERLMRKPGQAEDMPQQAAEPEPDESEAEGRTMREPVEAEDLPEQTAEPEAESTGEIPDWMQEAGWSEATGEAVEQPVSFSDAELRSLEAGELPPEQPSADDEEDDDLAPAELPDWMQGMAPGPGEEEADASTGRPDWVPAADDDQYGGTAAEQAEPEAAEQVPSDAPAGAQASETKQAEPGADQGEPDSSFQAADPAAEDLPSWMTEEAPGATDTIVAWLGGREREPETAPAEEAEEIPEWMKDTGPLADKGDDGIGIPSPTREPDDEQPAATPDWMEGILDAEDEPVQIGESAPDDAQPAADSAPAAGDQPSAEGEAGPGDGEPAVPGWLSAVAEVAAAESQAETEPEAEAPERPDATHEPESEQPAEQTPLQQQEPEHEQLTHAEPPAVEQQVPEDEQLTPAEPPDWLSEAMGEPPSAVEADQAMDESAGELADVEPPSWMAADSADDEWLGVDEAPDSAESEAETPEWLKGLADEGAEEAGAPRRSDAPDWLREIAEPGSAAVESDHEAAQPAQPAQAEPAAELPEQPAEQPAQPEAEPEAEIPGADRPVPEVETAPAEPADMETPPHGTAVPDWLQGLDDEPDAAQPGGEAPDWLGDIGQQAEPAEGAPDWLGDIGEEHESAPAAAAAPDWLGDIGDESQAEPEAEATADWPSEPVDEASKLTEAEWALEPESAGTPPADIDDDVISWLEDLAAAQEQTEIPETVDQAPAAEAEPPVMEQRQIPEQPEEGLEWLEQLADQRGLDVDVSLPEAPTPKAPEAPAAEEPQAPPTREPEAPVAREPQAPAAEEPQAPRTREPQAPAAEEPQAPLSEAEAPPAPEPAAPPAEAEPPPPAQPEEPAVAGAPGAEDSAPDWLTRMSTQPLPKVDLDALEAAAAAETSEAVDREPPPVDPAAETIRKRPEEFEAELAGEPPPAEGPAAEQELEAEATGEPPAVEGPAAEEEPTTEEEVPEWLMHAAAQEQAAPTDADLQMPGEAAAPPAEQAPPETPAEQAPPQPPVEEPAAEAPFQQPPREPPAAEEPALEPAAPPAEAAEPVAETQEPAEAPPDAETAKPAAPPAEAAEPVAETQEPAEAPPDAETAKPAALPAEAAEPVAETQEPAEAPPPAAQEPIEAAPEAVSPEAPEPAPPAPPKPAPEAEPELGLEQSRRALAAGETERAIELYGKLIKRKVSLEEVIEDLRMAVDRTPDNAALWQTLGDAFMKSDQSSEAIDAYRKGMEVA